MSTKHTWIEIADKKEFDALMRSYDEKGWCHYSGTKALDVRYDAEYTAIGYGSRYDRANADRKREGLMEVIIPFAHYAALNGISLANTATIQIGDYEATIDYDKQQVEINDEFIPFSKLAELHTLIQS